jgi:hypothetical protein
MKYLFLTSAALASFTLSGVTWADETSAAQAVSVDFSVPASLTPHYGNLDTFYVNLDTFYGNLDTFYGDLDTFYGDLDTFYGDLDTFYGDLDTFYGDLDTFYGDLDTFYGDLDTFYGDLDTFYGDLDTFYGDLDTFYGDLDTFWGNLSPTYGDLDTFYGDLDTFYGDLDTFILNSLPFVTMMATYHNDLQLAYGDLDTFYGDLDTFYGRLDSSYGDLDTFYGDLDTFGGNLNASYGDLDTFWGALDAQYGDLDTFYGDLDTFWGNLNSFYGDLDTFWGGLDGYSEDTAEDYLKVLQELGTFYNMSQEKFAVNVALYTGTDFWQGFAQDLFAKYGIDPTDASTLADMSALDRAKFYTEWYDGLMQFTGMDRVDHWMGAINWSPRLTQDHDYNSQAVIGLLDFGVTDETLLTNDVIYSGGYESGDDDLHGSAVVSLMIAPYDGRSTMGIAPNASVAVYNPFDETGTTNFDDVETGINALIANDARIINMSLGVPETVLSEEWSDLLDRVVSNPDSAGTIFVKAAGNEGAVQAGDIDWANIEALDRLILVGATGVDGEIADWSNTPGDACAIVDGVCHELMYNFIVAPGEFILVSDGDGGVMRQSGTSFAAPLVSGTAALMHGAWPWWKDYGEETVDVILQSATDLGEEGVDEVYGWGMLNAEAALSPLDWDKLRFYYAKSEDGKLRGHGMSADRMRKTFLRADTLKLEERGAYVVGLERVGDTFRDFRVPLSTSLYGGTTDLDGHAQERRFQRHLHQRFTDWATGASFGDTQGFVAGLGPRGDWEMSMVARPYAPGTDVREGDLPFQTTIVLSKAETGSELRMGYGDGASQINNSKVFGFYSDYSVETGGVNPVLGLASGGSYASAKLPVSERLSVTASITETSEDHSYIDPITGLRTEDSVEIADFGAQAANVSVGYQLNDAVRLNLDYTQLNERDSLLGDQGAGLLAMEGGAVTDAVTLGAETSLPYNFTLASSATLGKTRQTNFDNQFLSVGREGLETSAFAIGLHKQGVFGKKDQFRLSLSQPMRIENGELNFTALEVIDRETGELGEVTQVWAVDQSDREMNVEAIYALPVLSGAGEVTAFTRSGTAISGQRFTDETEVSFGTRLTIRY